MAIQRTLDGGFIILAKARFMAYLESYTGKLSPRNIAVGEPGGKLSSR